MLQGKVRRIRPRRRARFNGRSREGGVDGRAGRLAACELQTRRSTRPDPKEKRALRGLRGREKKFRSRAPGGGRKGGVGGSATPLVLSRRPRFVAGGCFGPCGWVKMERRYEELATRQGASEHCVAHGGDQ
jgi:hypothetical protein